MKRLGFIFLSALALTAGASEPQGYYNSLNGLTGKQLRLAAKAKVRSHTVISYGDNTWDAFEKTDILTENGKNYWWDMYSNNRVLISSGHSGLNIEHSVANSWWGKSKNDAYKDIVHLNPSNSDANSRKGNYPLTELKTVRWDNGVTFVGTPASGQGGGSTNGYEPADEYKGDFARVFMYMFTVYDDISWADNTAWMYNKNRDSEIFQQWAIDLLLKWHRRDPVSEKEIKRNDAIYGIQHNRNPFIDRPELAEYIWGSKKGEPYQPGDIEVDPGEDPNPGEDPGEEPNPNPGTDPVGENGTWTLVQNESSITPDGRYILVADVAGDLPVMSYINNTSSSNTYMDPASSSVSFEEANNLQVITEIPTDAAILSFTPLDAGKYAMQISDLDGISKGYLACGTEKKMTLASSATDVNAAISLSFAGSDVSLQFPGGYLRYNSSHPRFTTYKSGQQPLQLYRLNKDTATIVEAVDPAEPRTQIFTIQGFPVFGEFESLPAGTYIVVKPGKRSVKVIKMN